MINFRGASKNLWMSVTKNCGGSRMKKSIRFKVEKDRVLVPVGEPCPFACRYCYTRSGEVGLARVPIEEILQHLQVFASQNEFKTIQFGYDGDPFARPERGIAILQELAGMGKHVNFSTKAFLEDRTIKLLSDIQRRMESAERILSALVSLSCWGSSSVVEPHTPPPEMRMRTIKSLKAIGVPTFISVRPILPHIDDKEYETIIDEGLLAGCDGFILGPLYSDDKGRFVRFIPSDVLRTMPNAKVLVSWSAHSPVWTRYEDKTRLLRIESIVINKGSRVFESSAEAVELANRGRVMA